MSSQISIIRHKLTIAGQVQGVGFRPTVYRLALDQGRIGLMLPYTPLHHISLGQAVYGRLVLE